MNVARPGTAIAELDVLAIPSTATLPEEGRSRPSQCPSLSTSSRSVPTVPLLAAGPYFGPYVSVAP